MRACPKALALAFASGIAFSLASHAQQEAPREQPERDGKWLFRAHCSSCHGREAKGDGPLAEHLRVPPTDLTQLSMKNRGQYPYDRVMRQIDGRETVASHGSPDMPVWGDVFLKEAQDEDEAKARLERLVEYLSSIQQVSG
jgi:mono/diheme cytochrome c family protein